MKCLTVISGSLLVFCLVGLAPCTRASCVFESGDDIRINCAYKKSGLFRVRNLGGAKAHISLGLSIGDDFAFRNLLEDLATGDYFKRQTGSGRRGAKSIGGKAQTSNLSSGQNRQSRSKGVAAKSKSPKMGGLQASFKPKGSVGANKPIVQIFDAAKNSFIHNDIEIHKPNKPFKIYPVTPTNTMTIKTKLYPITPFQAIPGSSSKVLPGNFQQDPIRFSTSKKIPMLDLMGHTVGELATSANVSVRVVQAAIKVRQQQIMAKQQTEAYQSLMASAIKMSTTTTSTTTTQKPQTQYNVVKDKNVMNAPIEYYPVGYLNNFDDNFTSKIDLPKTTFHCGDQEYFPGLYADEDLSCTVFHVCALSGDGIVMKSFLCPKETLFDQTILKCNWWFYVDCTSSKTLYDSNIPVSKSYQLTKALTLFSNYKKNGRDDVNIATTQ